MDYLQITNLKIKTKIGVHKWEQAILQTLMLDIEIPMNISKCNDQIENTIDYAKLCQMITEHVENKSFALIETVATDVITLIKDNFQIDSVNINVSKPNAVANAGNISIRTVGWADQAQH